MGLWSYIEMFHHIVNHLLCLHVSHISSSHDSFLCLGVTYFFAMSVPSSEYGPECSSVRR